MGISITGTGAALPERVLTNDDLARVVDTSDEWITDRTGIRGRHILSEGESLTELGADAASRALQAAGRTAGEVDLILVGTSTSARRFPNMACLIQNRIGARNAVCMDISAACTGFVFALTAAEGFLRAGGYRRALVIGAEAVTRHIDWTDRNTCVLFGDGAGAVLLESGTEIQGDILASALGSDGSGGGFLTCASSGEKPYIHMNGQEIFRFAARRVPESIELARKRARIALEEIDHFILHQANIRLIEAIARRIGVPESKFPSNVSHTGNTSAASIPILLDELCRSGEIRRGEILALSGFGGGLTWGTIIIRW